MRGSHQRRLDELERVVRRREEQIAQAFLQSLSDEEFSLVAWAIADHLPEEERQEAERRMAERGGEMPDREALVAEWEERWQTFRREWLGRPT